LALTGPLSGVTPLTRRRLLALSAAGAASAALPVRAWPAVDAPVAGSLTAGRRALYGALVESLADAGVTGVDRSGKDRAEALLAERYGVAGCSDGGAQLDVVLDAVVGDAPASAFVGLSRPDRLSFLRHRLTTAHPGEQFLIRQALDLAALPFGRRQDDPSVSLVVLEGRTA
jgi:hypothetical protein